MSRTVWIAMISGVVALASNTSAETYHVGVNAWAGWAGFQVAAEKGFWEEQGIDVQVHTVSSVRKLYGMLENGVLDMGLLMLGQAVDGYVDGTPFVIIGEVDWSHGGDKIIVKRGHSLADDQGGHIGVYMDQTSVTFFLDKYLKSIHMSLADFRVIEVKQVELLADRFIDNTFPAIVAYDPEAIRAVREGNGEVVASTATYDGCMPEGVAMLRSKYDEMPDKDRVAFFRGYIEAVQWLKAPEHWDEFKTILNTVVFAKDKAAPYSDKDLKDMMDSVRIHDPQTLLERNKPGGGLEQYLGEVRVFLKATNKLKRAYTANDILETSALLEALSPSE